MNNIEIKNLSIGFMTEQGFRPALFDVSLKLKPGQMHAIVGESGCGKTLTATSILRLLPKNAIIKSGEILFEKQNLLALKESEMRKIRGAKIAFIPQDPMTSLNPLYTIGNQIIEAILCHKKISNQEAKKEAIKVLDLVKIPDADSKLNLYPHELSGGMKQRVIIATALALNAGVIIADEPTTALDVTIQAQIMSLLDEIKNEYNKSILIITHDLNLIGQYADEVSVMYAGNIVENAPNREFFKNPTHPYSKALLKSLPDESKRQLYTINGAPPNIFENITGCRFNPRCTYCTAKCKTETPKLEEIAPFHYVSCFNYNFKM